MLKSDDFTDFRISVPGKDRDFRGQSFKIHMIFKEIYILTIIWYINSIDGFKVKERMNILKKLLNFFVLEKTAKKNNFRKIIFSLRIRFLGLILLVCFIIISILTTIMYFTQINAMEQEKNEKAVELTQILSGPAEYYLDKDINTSKDELDIKYKTIVRETDNFKEYNKDIFKILLTDKYGNIRYSTDYKNDIGRNIKAYSYIKDFIERKEDRIKYYEVPIKTGKTAENYRAVSCPIILQTGLIVDLLNDFDKFYKEYQASNKAAKNRIYTILWRTYRNELPEEFDPENPANTLKDNKVNRLYDIDFLFLNLFNRAMDERKGIKRNPGLWNERWLYGLKQQKIDAYFNDNSSKANDANNRIIANMNKIYSEVKELRFLGVVSILFDVNKIKKGLNENTFKFVYIALIAMIISAILFLFAVNFMIKNIKKLEKWAIKISEGDLDKKIYIKTNDEIGRLSDIFNYMMEELIAKYHLEKFVSKSTKNMIDREKDSIKLGKTGKKNFVFLFSDVRGFTSFTEKNDPEVVMEVLNLYFDIQAKIIKSKKGDIDDYVGDQIMAHFGGAKKIDTAISVGISILTEIKTVNEERKKSGLPFFEIGIGINGGDVVVGNIGSGHRMDFCCVGDAVNLASRLCSNAEAGEILISKAIYSDASERYKAKEMKPISVKGKKDRIEVLSIRP
jgi:class 3 adenylate cyclase